MPVAPDLHLILGAGVEDHHAFVKAEAGADAQVVAEAGKIQLDAAVECVVGSRLVLLLLGRPVAELRLHNVAPVLVYNGKKENVKKGKLSDSPIFSCPRYSLCQIDSW
jgi:hypothetical protein